MRVPGNPGNGNGTVVPIRTVPLDMALMAAAIMHQQGVLQEPKEVNRVLGGTDMIPFKGALDQDEELGLRGANADAARYRK